MSRLFSFNMVTLDGYFEGPGHDISWHNVDGEFGEFAVAQLKEIGTLVFGRVTYELMASYWPTPAGQADDPTVAGLMNDLPKVVISKTLTGPAWANTRLIVDRVRDQLTTLKRESTKDLAVFGSAKLLNFLMQMDLVDEHRLMIAPLILGRGTPLFQLPSGKLGLKLVRSKAFANGNMLVCYEPIRPGV